MFFLVFRKKKSIINSGKAGMTGGKEKMISYEEIMKFIKENNLMECFRLPGHQESNISTRNEKFHLI